MKKPAILILCTGNCRSQMAEGILSAALNDDYIVASAGSKPAGHVHPLAMKVLADIGIDTSAHRSKSNDTRGIGVARLDLPEYLP